METSFLFFCYYYHYYLLLFVFICFLTKYLLCAKKLPPIPGLALPIVGHLCLFKKPLRRTFVSLSNKYGPVLFLQFGSPPVILVSSPSAAEECFTKYDIVFANRPRLLAGRHLGYNYTTLVWASYGDHWLNLRRIASLKIFSSRHLQMFYKIRADEVRLLTSRLFTVSSGVEFKTVDMKAIFFEMTLNVMMRMIAGKGHYGKNKAELEEERKFKEIVRETFELSGATNIVDFVPVLKWDGTSRIKKRLEILQQKRDQFMQYLIQEHKRMRCDEPASEERSKTMIDVLLGLQEAEPEFYTDEIIGGMMQLDVGETGEVKSLDATMKVIQQSKYYCMSKRGSGD